MKEFEPFRFLSHFMCISERNSARTPSVRKWAQVPFRVDEFSNAQFAVSGQTPTVSSRTHGLCRMIIDRHIVRFPICFKRSKTFSNYFERTTKRFRAYNHLFTKSSQKYSEVKLKRPKNWIKVTIHKNNFINKVFTLSSNFRHVLQSAFNRLKLFSANSSRQSRGPMIMRMALYSNIRHCLNSDPILF